jgi:DNA polymerase I-like protein with 3'-5' exonuclease and polymerase domains
MDVDAMDKLLVTIMSEIDIVRDKVHSLVPKRIIDQGEVKKPCKMNGEYTAVLERWYNNLDKRQFALQAIVGPFTRVSFEEVNLESPKQRIETLLALGWRPTEYNYKTDKHKRPLYENGKKVKSSPKLTEDSVENHEVGTLMIRYLTLSHRHKLTKGLRERLREDNRIGSGGITVGCNTGRMMHRNIVNIPRCGEFYGTEIRSLFSHKEGYTLLGADLASLENRLMGHYTHGYDNGAYANRLESEDSHETTVKLVKAAGKTITRNMAKTLNYALGYGAQIGKVAETLECDKAFAQEVYDLWWADKAAMATLKDSIERSLKGRGQLQGRKLTEDAWVKGLDGRKVYVRSTHSLINALIQNAGAVVNKFITCAVDKRLKQTGIDAHFVVNYHDEIALEVKDNEETIEAVKLAIQQSVDRCNDFFKFKVPMAMDIKTGGSWADIH